MVKITLVSFSNYILLNEDHHWLALYRGQDEVRKSGDDIFDCRILHDVLFGGPECLCVLMIEKGNTDRRTKKTPTLLVEL
jgi:hypothetical protein